MDRASAWMSCAVGERHGWGFDPAVEMQDYWVWAKTEECRLGIAFADAVGSNDIPEAKRIYTKIQALP